MEQFDFTIKGVADAISYLKENNDAFYKNVNAWQLLTKNETSYVSNPAVLEEANRLYKNLNK